MNEVIFGKYGVTEVYGSGYPSDGTVMDVNSLNVAIVVFIGDIHGAVHILDMGCTPDDRVDLEVDKWVKDIGNGLGLPCRYRFVKKVDNVYFYE